MRARRILIALAVIVVAAMVFAMMWTRSHRSATESSQSTGESADLLRRDIYPAGAQASSDMADALAQAARDKKRVLLDFGGNWCGDCRVLDFYFHVPPNLALLNANYVLVHVNVGNYDENLDLAAKYGIPLQKGVPALAVLTPSGQLLYSQRDGEFEAMGRVDSASVTDFLNKWKS